MRGTLRELREGAELDRCGRARLGAGWRHCVLEGFVAGGAFMPRPRLELAVLGCAVDDPEGTGRHAETTAVADVLLDVDGVELGPDQGAGGAGLEASRVGAMLADVGHHQPALILPARVGFRLLDELDVAPGGRPQRPGVVATVARHRKPVGGQLVPLLARHLARLAANAQAGIGEETTGSFWWKRRLDVHQPLVGVDHRSRPLRMLQVKALSSWM